MSNALYLMPDREFLQSMAAFDAGFQTPAAVLDGLTEEQAMAKPHGLPHSIAEIVGHMGYWQDFFNGIAQQGFSGFPEHAEEGWPKIAAGEWDALRTRFLASVELTQRLAVDCGRLSEKLLPEDFLVPIWQRESVGSGLLHAVVHNSHHLGQVVTLRQLLGLWPPQAGSMTW
ncbi:MAG: DinB family protein [Bryobacterales bacterium]